jgi:hypothetical protein
MRLYEVKLERGKRNPRWTAFFEAVTSLNGKAPDYSGIDNVAIVGSPRDPDTLKAIVTAGMHDDGGVTVEEITARTLNDHHFGYRDCVENYFAKAGIYPAP